MKILVKKNNCFEGLIYCRLLDNVVLGPNGWSPGYRPTANDFESDILGFSTTVGEWACYHLAESMEYKTFTDDEKDILSAEFLPENYVEHQWLAENTADYFTDLFGK